MAWLPTLQGMRRTMFGEGPLRKQQRLHSLDVAKLARAKSQQALAETKLATGLAQARATMLSTYQGATRDRTTADWRRKTVSADAAIIGDTQTLNAGARELARDDWSMQAILNAYRKHVVGTGITPHSNARDPETGDAMTELNDTLDRWWGYWSRDKKFVDVERTKTFTAIQALIIREMVTVGQAFVFMSVSDRPEMVGLSLQMFGPEQLDMSVTKGEKGNVVRAGIELDAMDAPVAYWVLSKQNANTGVISGDDGGGRQPLLPDTGTSTTSTHFQTSARVPAERVIHLFDAERVRQTQGVTPLSSVILKMRHLSMYTEYEMIAARLEACFCAFVSQPANERDNTYPGVESETNSAGQNEITFEPGIVNKLSPGQTVDFNTPKRPGGQFTAFTEAMIMQIASGADLDYALVARDYTKGNFSSQRQATLEANSLWDELQQKLINEFCRPVRDMFVRMMILEGRVDAGRYWTDPETHLAMNEAEWQGPARNWVEPVKQANAIKIAIAQGLTTRGTELNKLGLTFDDVLRGIADEKQLAEELGIEFPENAKPNAPSSSGEPSTPAEEPPPKKNDEAEGGERDKRT